MTTLKTRHFLAMATGVGFGVVSLMIARVATNTGPGHSLFAATPFATWAIVLAVPGFAF